MLGIFVLFVIKFFPQPINNLEVINVSRSTDQRSIEIRKDIQDKTGFEVPHEILWHVQLRGNANWINEVQKHELNGYFTAKSCAHRDWELFGYGPFADGIEVSAYGKGIENIDVSKQPAYNLHEDLVEVCLSIAGGAMHGAYGKSNEVRFYLKS